MKYLLIFTSLSVITVLATWQGVSYYRNMQQARMVTRYPTYTPILSPSPIPTEPCILQGCGQQVGCASSYGIYIGNCHWETGKCISTSDCKNTTEVLAASTGQVTPTDVQKIDDTEIVYLNEGRIVHCKKEVASEVRRSYDEWRRLINAFGECGFGGIQDSLDCLDRCIDKYDICKLSSDIVSCGKTHDICANYCKQGSVLDSCNYLRESSGRMWQRVDELVAKYCQ